jgi:hypothetical protein
MNNKVPRGLEIILRNGIENTVIIDIPKTNLKLLGELTAEETWDVTIIDRAGEIKRTLQKGLDDEYLSLLISHVLAHPEQTEFKERDIESVKKFYKSIIKTIKSENQLNS